MKISVVKALALRNVVEPIREVEDEIIEQVMKLSYLGAFYTTHSVGTSVSSEIQGKEVNIQVLETNIVVGLHEWFMWNNKYHREDTNERIYKSTIRAMTRYRTEGRSKNIKTG